MLSIRCNSRIKSGRNKKKGRKEYKKLTLLQIDITRSE